MAGYSQNNEYPKGCNHYKNNEYDQQIIIRRCSEPTEHVSKIYTDLHYKSKPLTRKKSIVPLTEIQKSQTPINPMFFFQMTAMRVKKPKPM